jgi:hypothetical protein
MLPVPVDEAFVVFVTDRRDDGLSSASIAGALNTSRWADPHGGSWNWQQVAALCWSAELAPSAPQPNGGDEPALGCESTADNDQIDVSSPCTREDCEFHRLQRLLRSMLDWSPFDGVSAAMITGSYQAGHSLDTIAARLNRSATPAPTGKRWSAQLVRVLLSLYESEPAVVVEPAAARGALSSLAA